MNINKWYDFLSVIKDIISHDDVRAMMKISHHYGVSCYEHSVFVAYLSFRTARKLGLDYTAAAKAALLHDLYLYNNAEKKNLSFRHYTVHPKKALKNALEITELSGKEQNIILSHMWPVPGKLPRSREAVLVNLVDKYCAVVETVGIWHKMRMSTLVNYMRAA